MTRRKDISALAGPFVIATALVFTTVSAGAVEVIRGDAPNQTTSSAVVVLRGASPVAPQATSDTAPPQTGRIVAGETFWTLDGDGHVITACNLIKTASVGRDRIACWRRDFRTSLTD